MNAMEVNIHYFRLINDLGKQYPMWNPVFYVIAEYMVYGLALAVFLYWFRRTSENRMMVICGTVTFFLAELFGKVAGSLHYNQQPSAELTDVNQLVQKAVNNSFPSDHTILFFSFCMSFWLFKKRSGIFWMLLALCMGISRIWVGVHYPADVIVGALISIGSALAVYLVVPRLPIVHTLLGFYEKAEQALFPAKQKSRDL
ncbi:undecaprenyl-diphosphatase [Brevibacillus choshinensis]|uniref:Undecaprenyl-diphosphatase n=1 Tax=Brevibacillus choshinensis TaxID=54911 RepID=A0ABX7FWJ1_BRECH|nr:undecaprenyl-diphosphatase [Brevibacillus choshinensis]QRG70259.1 undecaprenyl-diphosphatase [Brevibacillus choshinensis]